MSGQRRALAVVLLLGALTLPGCAATVDPGLPCELPDDTQLVAGDDGGYLVVYDDGAMYDLAFANGRCVINQRRLAIPRAERSDADLIFLYDYYRLRLGPCLDLYGYSYLAPPSREDFVASGGNWSPYDSVFQAMLSVEDLLALNNACPELPPKVLFPG